MSALPARRAVIATLALAVGTAHAGDDTCARLRAVARAEAVLLYAPRIELEGARTPRVVDATDPTATATGGLQARVALALSPVDMLRGRAVERVAAAECASDDVSEQLERVLAIGARYGELAATRAELDYIEAHLGEVDALFADATAALARQRATALEVDEVRGRRATLRRRASDLRDARALLVELDGAEAGAPDLDALAARARAAVLDVDRKQAVVGELSAWRFDIRAGVAGADRADYFAVIELGYSLGQRWQRAADRKAVRARAAELTADDRSVTVRAARLRRAMRASVAILDDEVAILDDELAALATDRARLDGLDSDAARALRSRSTLARIELEARRASVVTLAAARRALIGSTP